MWPQPGFLWVWVFIPGVRAWIPLGGLIMGGGTGTQGGILSLVLLLVICMVSLNISFFFCEMG